jgi:hypothetical protein
MIDTIIPLYSSICLYELQTTYYYSFLGPHTKKEKNKKNTRKNQKIDSSEKKTQGHPENS